MNIAAFVSVIGGFLSLVGSLLGVPFAQQALMVCLLIFLVLALAAQRMHVDSTSRKSATDSK
jgi:hypothetical protein